MTEIHVVRSDNAHLYEDELDQYFRGRYKYCVLERGWKGLERSDEIDIDQFDTRDTIHLLAINARRVVGGIRFCSSMTGTVLNKVFPYLSSSPLIPSPEVYELTRIWVAKDARAKIPRPTVEAMITAGSIECAVVLGMHKLWAMIEPWRILRNQSLGWTVWPLGEAHRIDGADVIAVEKDVSESIWASVCQKASVPGPILVWRGTRRPHYRLPELVPAVA